MARTAYSKRKLRSRRPVRKYAPRPTYRKFNRRVRGVTRITRRSPRSNNSVFNFKRRSIPKALWLINGAVDDIAGTMIFWRFQQSGITDNLRYIVLNSTLGSSIAPITPQGCVTLQEYSSFSQLFKMFRICKIKMNFTPSLTAGTSAYSVADSGAANGAGAVAGSIVYDIVRDDGQYNDMYPFNELGQDLCMESISAKTKSIYKHHKMYFTPSVLTSLPVVGSTYNMKTPSYKRWMPLLPENENDDVLFNGIIIRARLPKQCIQQSNLSAFDGTDFPIESNSVPIGMIRFTYYFQMKYQG